VTADEILREVVKTLEALDVPYAIGGSLASIAYGEPRATLDLDIVIDLKAADVDRLVARLDPAEFHLDAEQAREAIERRGQFNVIVPRAGFKIDFFVVGDDIERRQIEHRRRLPALPGLEAASSPPEELILKKLLTWRRAILGGGAAFALLGVLTAGYLFMRTAGIGPAGTLIARGVVENVEPLVEALADRFYIEAEAVREAIRDRTRFNRLRLASAEDTVVLKLHWYRLGEDVSERRWEDAIGIIKVQGARLDHEYLRATAAALGVKDLLAQALAEEESSA